MMGTFAGTTVFGLNEPNETVLTPPGDEWGSTDIFIAEIALF